MSPIIDGLEVMRLEAGRPVGRPSSIVGGRGDRVDLRKVVWVWRGENDSRNSSGVETTR